MADTRVKLFTIEDNNVKAMMQDPQIVALLPCLRNSQTQLESVLKGKKNCNRCEAEKKQIVSDAMNQAKVCIHSTRGSKLQQLKKLLNAKQLRVVTRNGTGRRVKFTF